MATVQSYTKAKSDEIYDATVIDGNVVGDDLHLTTRGGADINAGNVRGPTGATGATGPAGDDGTSTMVKDVLLSLLASTGALIEDDSDMGPSQSNVPQVSGHTYEIHVELELAFANFYSGGATPRWDFWVKRNGALFHKFARYEENRPGAHTLKVSGSIFYEATTTGSTDDFTCHADEVVAGAVFQRTDTEAYMKIIDWGVQ